ncbi:hypothetical protein ACQKFX_21375 [Cupriavidus metallidurans]|uniref:hypothetical protein n=1 Tax=Cupriavidus metallidurans TaxID=119219 RepID=UPI003CFFACB0
MARYRPVSPEHTWRSSKSAELTISERYGELYLLTTPFANTIGCFQIVPRIAAAEAGLSQEEFLNVLERLNSRRIASFFEEGYVLVRSWFRHSSWESTLQGNVAKAALREISALPPAVCDQWCQAAVEVGVPEEIVRSFVPEVSPLEGACKDLTLLSNAPAEPLAHNNHNENVTQQRTTNRTRITRDTRGGSRGIDSGLAFEPAVLAHRELLGSLLSRLPLDAAQDIVDELAGVLEAAREGKHPGITGRTPRGWIAAMASKWKTGDFILDLGQSVQARRAQRALPQPPLPEPTDKVTAISNLQALRPMLRATGSTR